MRRIYLILMAFCILFPGADRINAAGKRNTSGPFLETQVDRDRTVEGERLIYEVILFTSDPMVAGVEVISNPVFEGLDISRSASDSHLMEVEKDGKILYRAVIDRFFIGTGHKGKFTLKGGDYRIGFNREYTVDDPFWGPAVANRVETLDLKAPDLKISVASLPEKGKPDDFSGAVGNFSVEVSLEMAPVVRGDGNIIISISGMGDLTDARIPDIPSAFGDGIHFKSMTDTRNHFIHQGHLGSEMEIECSFSADAPGKYTISPIRFCFFDSMKGEYIVAESEPLEIEVADDKRENEPPPTIMDI